MKNLKNIKKVFAVGIIAAALFFLVEQRDALSFHGPTVPVDDAHLYQLIQQELIQGVLENSLIGNTLTTDSGMSIVDVNEQIMIAVKGLVEKQVGVGALGSDYEPLLPDPSTAETLGITSWDGLAQEALKPAIQDLLSSMETAIFEGIENFHITGPDGLPILGDGSPLFIQDLLGYLDDVGVATFFDFLEGDLGALGSLQGPVADVLEERFETRTNFEKRVTPLYSLPAGDPQAFTEGDFSAGGWEMWLALSQDPARNPWTLALIAEEEAERRAEERQTEELELLRFGDGFFPMRDEDGRITTPGIAFADQLEILIGSDLRQLEIATDFDAIFDMFLGGMFEQFFSGGIFGFFGGILDGFCLPPYIPCP